VFRSSPASVGFAQLSDAAGGSGAFSFVFTEYFCAHFYLFVCLF